jgi:short subunit dehydrogenase-like uncharacterized protein
MSTKEFDLTVYGATGFVGQLAVRQLAQHADLTGRSWAIAGRDARKLAALRDAIDADHRPQIVVADAHDERAVDAMAARTAVLLDFAGPYLLYGDAIVAACVRHRTHFADITGETHWIRGLIDCHHEQATADGTRIVNCCGFDSVPSDLGVYALVRYAQHALGQPCGDIRSAFRMAGGVNGGTLASGLAAYGHGHAMLRAEPHLLTPEGGLPAQRAIDRDPMGAGWDDQLRLWTAPFVMAAINTRIVRRSAGLYALWGEPYADEFHYQEFAGFGRALGPLAPLAAGATAVGLKAAHQALSHDTPRKLLQRLLPPPGSGPSEARMDAGWFACDFAGRLADDSLVRARIRHQGDPGNRATVTFACEAALGLLCDQDALPGGRERGGVLTPATALGDVLITRLAAAGVAIEILPAAT